MTDQIQKTLIDDLGLSDLPADKKDQLLMKMTEVVLKRIFLETMEKLNDKDQDEYSKMIDENAEPEQLEKFLQEKIAGYEGMVTKIVTDFVEEMKVVS
ncbi:MAG: DUF5663 domain-containing protein [Parcubacteria group bacterium]